MKEPVSPSLPSSLSTCSQYTVILPFSHIAHLRVDKQDVTSRHRVDSRICTSNLTRKVPSAALQVAMPHSIKQASRAKRDMIYLVSTCRNLSMKKGTAREGDRNLRR